MAKVFRDSRSVVLEDHRLEPTDKQVDMLWELLDKWSEEDINAILEEHGLEFEGL